MRTEDSSNDIRQSAATASAEATLASLAGRLEDRDEARAVREVFEALFGLLREVEGLDVEKGDEQEKARSIFRTVRAGALALAELIETGAFAVGEGGELAGALSGVGFALRHELRSVFGEGTEDEAASAAAEPGRAAHAHGLLRNCFQQCILLVGKAADSGLDEAELFGDGRVRLRQTLLLRDALTSLIASVTEAERKHYPQSAVALIEEVEKFRRESLGYLMRKDWAAFESLAAEVVSAREVITFKLAARRFHTYVETLLAHVQMRAVLAQHTPARVPPPANHFMQAVRKPAAWSAAAACVLAALVFFVAPVLRAKDRAADESAQTVAHAEAVTVATKPAEKKSVEEKPAAGVPARREANEGRVVVQLGAYGSESVAAAQAARLRGAGVQVFVTRAQASGGTVFRVQAGPFGSRAEATLAGKRLQESGAVQTFVVAELG